MKRIAKAAFAATATSTSARPAGPIGRFTLAILGAALGTLLLAASAPAAAPTLPSYETSFTCSATSKCGPKPGGGEIESLSPGRLAVNEATGDVYVIDVADQRVLRFSSAGAYLSQLEVPAGQGIDSNGLYFGGEEDDIAVDNSATATQGNVYVVGEHGVPDSRITAFDASGGFLWQVKGQVETAPFSDICGVAVDPAGNLWSVDYYNGLRRRSASDGSVLASGSTPTETCHAAFDSTGAFYLAYWSGPLEKFDPPAPFSGGSTQVDAGSNLAVATDSATDNVYTDHGSAIAVYDATGAAVGAPFGAASTSYFGVAVDGAHRRAYLANTTTGEVDVWSTANPATFALTVAMSGTGTGTVTSSPAGIDCGSTCSAEYYEGKEVTLTPAPAAHSTFAGWSGACTGTGACEVTMSAAKSVTATFALETRSLTVDKAGSGTGTVTCDGGACAASYPYGAKVALAASPASGSSFAGWSGAGCSGTGGCEVTLTADTAVTATFTANLVVTPPPPVDNSAAYGQCVARANKAFKRAKKAARRKHGKARTAAIKKAKRRHNKAVAACRAQFK